MATRLHRKINSYPINTGIEFNEAYTLPPTQTGSNTTTTDWTMTGTAPVYESSVGPIAGGGSWKFTSGPTSGNCRLRNTTAGFGNMMYTIYGNDLSLGFWVKINSMPASGSSAPLQSIPPFANNGGYFVGIRGIGSSQGQFFLTIDGTTQVLDTTITVNTTDWYYIAVTKGPGLADDYNFYVNGQTNTSATTASDSNTGTSINWGQVSQGYEFSFNISNFYIGYYDDVTPADIVEIWNVGSSSRIVKHYDGDSWEESYDQKVWNGSAWEQWDSPKYWNGTSWVAV
jgi:hypothetical protein